MAHPPHSAQEVTTRLRATGYLPDQGRSTITYLALAMGRPLLRQGEPGTGKTALAEALAATVLDAPLIRLQCHEGIDASQALHDWDFARGWHRRGAATPRPAGRGHSPASFAELSEVVAHA